MLKVINNKKINWFSNIVLASFLILVIGTMYLSNVFKSPIKGQQELIDQSLVFNNKELEKVIGLSLKNKSGDFTFERTDTENTSTWHMTSPRDISVNSLFIEKLFSSLNIIKTKKLLNDDKSNNSNFSLEKPTAILTLTDNQGKSIVLSVGIMNTIDNSTYIKISERPGIYHVEAPSISLENITLTDLVESSVFNINLNEMLSFKIFKNNSNSPHFEIIKKNGVWVNSEDKALDIKRLEDMINDFTVLKSSFTLDSPNDAQKKQTQSLLSKPEFILKIEGTDKEVLKYRISAVTANFPEAPLKEESYFIINENHSPIIYVVKKDFLNLFEVTNDTLKPLILPIN